MPVDFTKDTKKTNVQYLRELITVGHEERIEFLEAIETELDNKNERILELEGELEEAGPDENAEQEEPEYANSEDIYLGSAEELKWDCANLAVQEMMEVLVKKVKKYGPLTIESLLNTI